MAIPWKLRGRVTEDGKLDVELPAGVPAGDVDVQVTPLAVATNDKPEGDESMEWTPEEWEALQALSKLSPKSPQEVIEMLQSMDAGSWADIDDPVEFDLKLREEEARRKNLQW